MPRISRKEKEPNLKTLMRKGRKKKGSKIKKSNHDRLQVTLSNHLLGVKCPICMEDVYKDKVTSTKCGHIFCTACLKAALASKSRCPTCRARLNKFHGFHPLYL